MTFWIECTQCGGSGWIYGMNSDADPTDGAPCQSCDGMGGGESEMNEYSPEVD